MLKKTVYPILCLIIIVPFLQAVQEKPDITKTIEEIESQYKNKNNRDIDKIVASFEYLGKVYSEVTPSDQSSIIKAIGSFAEPKNTKRIFKLLWSSENRIIVAASRYGQTP